MKFYLRYSAAPVHDGWSFKTFDSEQELLSFLDGKAYFFEVIEGQKVGFNPDASLKYSRVA